MLNVIETKHIRQQQQANRKLLKTLITANTKPRINTIIYRVCLYSDYRKNPPVVGVRVCVPVVRLLYFVRANGLNNKSECPTYKDAAGRHSAY